MPPRRLHALRPRVWARARCAMGRAFAHCAAASEAGGCRPRCQDRLRTPGRQREGLQPADAPCPPCHPLLACCTDTNAVVQAWPRTGSALTSSGLVGSMLMTAEHLPGELFALQRNARHARVLRQARCASRAARLVLGPLPAERWIAGKLDPSARGFRPRACTRFAPATGALHSWSETASGN